MGGPGWGYPQSVRPVPLLPCILRRGQENVHIENEPRSFRIVFSQVGWEVPDRSAISRGEGGKRYVPIRNEDKPLPRAGEGGGFGREKTKFARPPTPRGLVGFRRSRPPRDGEVSSGPRGTSLRWTSQEPTKVATVSQIAAPQGRRGLLGAP